MNLATRKGPVTPSISPEQRIANLCNVLERGDVNTNTLKKSVLTFLKIIKQVVIKCLQIQHNVTFNDDVTTIKFNRMDEKFFILMSETNEQT